MQAPSLNKLILQYCLLAPLVLVLCVLIIHLLSQWGSHWVLGLMGSLISVPLFLVPMITGCHMISKAYVAGGESALTEKKNER
jgi:hypothetical protein